ncbi:hypothetical protein GE118_01935 [Mycoplasma sp. NEAQ87857]|uniref:hypothetical protein n=1 Tax=Mycoplasma sp. NEAQ87857 TaxID=2683967 RepID=UPI0013175A1C|nr:hypothetical protein [Mycoplasma sp. NEAQ87857]QGZ97555.1 hypothetical protein GE118_01935 [Mycoplasma sp. NEAQ87857]
MKNNLNSFSKFIKNNKKIFSIVFFEIILFIIFLAITKFLMISTQVSGGKLVNDSGELGSSLGENIIKYGTITNDLLFISIFGILFNLITWTQWHSYLKQGLINNQKVLNRSTMYWILFNIALVAIYSLTMLLFEHKPRILGLNNNQLSNSEINRYWFLIGNALIVFSTILIITNISKYLVMRNINNKFFKIIISIFALTAIIPVTLVIPFFVTVWKPSFGDKYNYIFYPSLVTFATISPILALLNPFYSFISVYSLIASKEVFGYMYHWTSIPTIIFIINVVLSGLFLTGMTFITFYTNKKYLIKERNNAIVDFQDDSTNKFTNKLNNLVTLIKKNKALTFVIMFEIILFTTFLAITNTLISTNYELTLLVPTIIGWEPTPGNDFIINDLVFTILFGGLFNLVIWVILHFKWKVQGVKNIIFSTIKWTVFNFILLAIYSVVIISKGLRNNYSLLNPLMFIGINVIAIVFGVLIATNISKFLILRNSKSIYFKIIALVAIVSFIIGVALTTSLLINANLNRENSYDKYKELYITYGFVSPILTILNPFYSFISLFSTLSLRKLINFEIWGWNLIIILLLINLIINTLYLISLPTILFILNYKKENKIKQLNSNEMMLLNKTN